MGLNKIIRTYSKFDLQNITIPYYNNYIDVNKLLSPVIMIPGSYSSD
jgi:hypothetical protein